MGRYFKISLTIFTLFSAGAFAQSPSKPSKPAVPKAPAAQAAPAAAPTPQEIELKKLWGFYNDQTLGDMLVVFKRKNQNNPQIAILDDPEVKKKIRLYFYDRFAKTYSKTISLKEISYLNQLYASDLMNRVHAADLETWESNQIQIDRLFKEAIKEQSSAAPKKPQR